MSIRLGGLRAPVRAVGGILAILLLIALWPGPVYSEAGFRTVTGPCGFRFPEDHGPHPGFRTEWWYYTGNVETAAGRRFGYQLTFFRRQMAPSDVTDDWPEPASDWRTLQIYLAHLAVSDIRGEIHRHAESMARSALDMAGTETQGEAVRVFLKSWSAVLGPNGHHLEAAAPD